MNPLDAFLHHLHFDVDKVRPLDLQVDWDDAPLPYKLYRGRPRIPLSAEVPLTLCGLSTDGVIPNLTSIGHFLWYAYGLAQYSQAVLAFDAGGPDAAVMHSNRRYAPSGGGLYPNEVYVYLKLVDVTTGIYHYDAAHHQLVLLRAGNVDEYVTRALGHRCDVGACFGTVFISTMFWKNFFKYDAFAYRLQGLDTGVLIGQLLSLTKRFGYHTGIHYQFLDRPMNHLLGLREQEESVYAVLPLTQHPDQAWVMDGKHHPLVTADGLCESLCEVRHEHYVKSQTIRDYRLLTDMNEAAMLETTGSFSQISMAEKSASDPRTREVTEGVVHPPLPNFTLPTVMSRSTDYAVLCKRRYSPGMDFLFQPICQTDLAELLIEAVGQEDYRNDLGDWTTTERPDARVTIYACLHGAEGIPDGAWRYQRDGHRLAPVRPGDLRMQLQEGMSMHNVNLFQVPVCLHLVGDATHLQSHFGYRGYRIQQMEAGILVQRVLMAACAVGMDGHPLLGYDVARCDALYQLAPGGMTTLIQIPIGRVSKGPRWEVGMHV